MDYVRHAAAENAVLKGALHGVKGVLEEAEDVVVVRFKCPNDFLRGQLMEKNGNLALLQAWAAEYFGPGSRLAFDVEAGAKPVSQKELRAKAEQMDLFREARDEMGAYIIDVRSKS